MNRAYSLVEMMVIVAIVAIMTGIAIPIYQDHMQTARMARARQYMDSFNSRIINYYTDNGIIPTNSNLGLPTAVPTSAAQYLHKPYVAYMTVGPQTTTASQCQYGISTGYFSNYSGDYFANGNSRYVVFNNYFIDNNGTMTKLCSYYEFDPSISAPTTTDLFSDCIRTMTPNTSEIMTLINTACAN